MARVHARSWRATYTGLVPDAVINDIVGARSARIERWRSWLADPQQPGGSFVAEMGRRIIGFVFWGPSEGPDAKPEVAEVYSIYLDPEAVGRLSIPRSGTCAIATSGRQRCRVRSA
jgi:hypothetical protein